MTHASLCSGIGAAELAATWTGWENAFLCENDPFCRRVLNYWFNKSKIYGDIRETDFTEWCGRIDVLTAGFPCQPFSVAGRRKGADDDRYLWPEIIRVIGEVQPGWFIGENVAGIVSMVQPGSEVDVESPPSLFGEDYTETALEQEYIPETVCRDLERAGYTVQPVIVPACAVGAPHRRDRIFFIANRSDAGIESMRERQNGIHERPAASDTIGNDAGRCGYSEAGRSPEESKGREKERERIREVAERISNKGASSDTDQFNGNISGFCAGEVSQHEASGIFGGKTTSHPISGGCQQNNESEPSGKPEQSIPDWRNFPTQPPVRREYDGVSETMVRNIKKEVYVTIRKSYRGEDLSEMRKIFSKEEVWEQIGRLYKIQSKEILLKTMQLLETPDAAQGEFSPFGEKASDEILRKLRKYGKLGHTPQGRKLEKQFREQFNDALSPLSHEIALAAKAIQNACLSFQKWHRNGSIKAFGNAIVPQVMYEIFKAIDVTSNNLNK
jgi:DNA (cytosine-5)-methyltransferase 1